MKVILLNGPPRAGKDTAADAIAKAIVAQRVLQAQLAGTSPSIAAHEKRIVKLGLSYPLKTATHALYGMPDAKHDAFEQVKDAERSEFFGRTPRCCYISVSEAHMKPLHGKRVFGKLWVRTIEKNHEGADIAIVPDSGFVDEAWPIVEHVGMENVLLWCIHAEGRGKTFDNDSRSYIELPGVQTYDIYNDSAGPEGRDAFIRKITAGTLRWLDMGVA